MPGTNFISGVLCSKEKARTRACGLADCFPFASAREMKAMCKAAEARARAFAYLRCTQRLRWAFPFPAAHTVRKHWYRERGQKRLRDISLDVFLPLK